MPVAYVSLWRVSESLHRDLYSNFDGAVEALPHLIRSFIVFCTSMWPYVFPPLLAILLEAPLSLRTWIAVQRTPTPQHTNTPPRSTRLRKLRKHAFTHLTPVYFLSASLLASYLQTVAHVSPDRMLVFEIVMLGPLFWFATSRLFGLLLRIYTLSVRRDAGGDPHIVRTLHPCVPSIFQIFPVLLGLLITYRAIHVDCGICKTFVQVALIHIFVSLNSRSRESMRAACIYSLTNIATLLALTIFLALQASKIKHLLNASPSPPGPYPAWEEFNSTRLNLSSAHVVTVIPDSNSGYNEYESNNSMDDSKNGYRWPLFALAVLWNIFPVELITLCYRFDYTRFVRLQGLSLASIPCDESRDGQVRAEETEKKNGGSGPSITHDMLLDTTREREKISDVGPIYLTPEAPDSFYARLSPPPYPSTISSLPRAADSDTSNRPTEIRSTPLPSSLSLPTPTPILFPAFLTSLAVYLTSTILLSMLCYATAQDQKQEALKCLAPLLPLVTLPLTTFSIPIGLALTAGDEDATKELWGYEEDWRAETKRTGENSSSGIHE